MEPLNDNELRELLNRWEAPAAPASMERRIFGEPERPRWHHRLLWGSIRVPVPVAAVLLIALWSAWIYLAPAPRSGNAPVARELTLSDFQPVKELKPRVVRNGYEEN